MNRVWASHAWRSAAKCTPIKECGLRQQNDQPYYALSTTAAPGSQESVTQFRKPVESTTIKEKLSLLSRRLRHRSELQISREELKGLVLLELLRDGHLRVQLLVVHRDLNLVGIEGVGRVVVKQERVRR